MQDTQTGQPAPPADAPATGSADGDTGAEHALTTLRDEIADQKSPPLLGDCVQVEKKKKKG